MDRLARTVGVVVASVTDRPTDGGTPDDGDDALERDIVDLTQRLDPVPRAVVDAAKDAFRTRGNDKKKNTVDETERAQVTR
jgi:hypothetical protein